MARLEDARQLVVMSDLDKIQLRAPAATGTLKSLLLRKQLKIPGADAELKPYVPNWGLLSIAILRLAHSPFLRRVDPDGKKALAGFKILGEEQGMNVHMMAVSGRQPCLHQMTIAQLEAAGYGEYFEEYHLNMSRSSTLHKRKKAADLHERFPDAYIIHLEDDTKPAIAVGEEIGDEGCVFMKNNLANDPRLLARAGIILPINVFRVDRVSEAPEMIKERLISGTIQLAVSHT